MTAEQDDSCKDAYQEEKGRYIPEDASIVASHALLKIKVDDQGNITLKGRITVHGNLEADKEKTRVDYSATDMAVIRIVVSIGTCLGFTFESADIKSVYMQSGPIKRDTYGRPPMDCKRKEPLCGNFSNYRTDYSTLAGWSMKIEEWWNLESKLERVFGVPQLFMDSTGTKIDILVPKVTDDFLDGGVKDNV